jgi:hypothetical protein
MVRFSSEHERSFAGFDITVAPPFGKVDPAAPSRKDIVGCGNLVCRGVSVDRSQLRVHDWRRAFINNGWSEMMENHPVPPREQP